MMNNLIKYFLKIIIFKAKIILVFPKTYKEKKINSQNQNIDLGDITINLIIRMTHVHI